MSHHPVDSAQMKRAAFVAALGAGALALVTLGRARSASSETYRVTHTDELWRRLQGDDRYYILREGGTEPPNSSPLIAEKRAGLYRCAGCSLALFSSTTKYDSGDGWPSFWDVLPNAIAKKDDRELIEERTEVHCRQCGGHLGHVFDDGPKPTYLRYCIDGLALHFVPA